MAIYSQTSRYMECWLYHNRNGYWKTSVESTVSRGNHFISLPEISLLGLLILIIKLTFIWDQSAMDIKTSYLCMTSYNGNVNLAMHFCPLRWQLCFTLGQPNHIHPYQNIFHLKQRISSWNVWKSKLFQYLKLFKKVFDPK